MSLVKVAVRVDANAQMGVGHAVRCLALVQELRRRDIPVRVYGDLNVPWVSAGYRAEGIEALPASQLADGRATHAILDGYDLPPALGETLRGHGARVLAMVDDAFGADQVADIYVDQNFGARPHRGGPSGSVALAGAEYSMVRSDVLAARDLRLRAATHTDESPSVLAVFGGTDPFNAAETMIPLLVETGADFRATVVCPDPARAEALAKVPHAGGQQLNIVGALTHLPTAAAQHDIALTAAGSTVWELLTIGVPTGVVCVVDNQEPGYTATTAAGLVAPAGRLPLLQARDAAEQAATVAALRALLTDSAARADLTDAAAGLFDGRGRERVADALLTSDRTT